MTKVNFNGSIEPSNEQVRPSAVPEGLDRKRIYTSSELKKEGYIIARLKVNRVVNLNAVKMKKKSLRITEGPATPGLVVTARVCLACGLDVILEDVTVVNYQTPNLDKILVLVDGVHRSKAIAELATDKNDPVVYDNLYIFPQKDGLNISSLLKEVNVATNPWKGSDFLTSLIIERSSKGADVSKFQWIQELAQDGSETSAYWWADMASNRAPSKTKLIKAVGDDKVFEELADTGRFEEGKEIYKTLSKSFSKKTLGLKVYPQFFIKKMDAEFNVGKKTKSEATKLLVAFANSFDRQKADEVESLRGEKGQSKDQKITDKLELFFQEFLATYDAGTN